MDLSKDHHKNKNIKDEKLKLNQTINFINARIHDE